MPDKSKGKSASLRDVQQHDYDDWLSLYLRLARIFRHRIRIGVWKPGSRIPTIPELCAEFGASRTPVRQAMALLVQDGIIQTVRGRGTFVAEDFESSIDDESLRISISDPLVLGSGQTFKVLQRRVVDRLPDDLACDQPLYPTYVEAKKTHAHNKTPFACMNIFVAQHYYKKFPPRADEKHKTVHLLRAYTKVKPVRYQQEITIVHANEDIACILGVSLASVIVRVRRWWVDDTGKVAWASLSFYRGDMFVLDMIMEDKEGNAFGLRAVAPGSPHK